jgi:hypothetical protein
MKEAYWGPDHVEPEDRVEILLDEMLMTDISENNYPGNSVESPNWPFYAPGNLGIINGLSGKYCNWTGIVGINPKPPILYVYGAKDNIVNDESVADIATLGKLGVVPDWPGEEVFP